MATLVSLGDVLFFGGGFAACWFFKDRIVAAIAWVKAKV
jgi:hypothetical protein